MSDPNERMGKYQEFLVSTLVEYQKQSYLSAMELFEKQKDSYEDSFCHAFQKAEEFLERNIALNRKGKLKYIHLSYLLSGALSGEHLVKMDFYDNRYYKDVEETDCFWDCSELFPLYEEGCRTAEVDMKREIVRVQSGELSRIWIGFTVCDYLILKSVLKELVKSESFLKRLLPYCGSHICILYGAYLDEAEVIYRV